MPSHFAKLLIALVLMQSFPVISQNSETIWLSGRDKDHTVNWQFFCTDGHNSGKWTTIPVPSCWELQGFGTYNYGQDRDNIRGKEKGLYKYMFSVPAAWKGKSVTIVFEGSMTDTEVKINGRHAGEVHQGAFYRFSYDVSDLLRYGKDNLLEVMVAKHSANESVNEAERRCDYWIFGGIFRPVYLEAKPAENIRRIALNAGADGTFTADIYLSGIQEANKISARIYDLSGNIVGNDFSQDLEKGSEQTRLKTKIEGVGTWSPEFPQLYKVEVSLLRDEQPVHTISERFGFRTVELRERDGIYVNGTKVKFKGVCRHSFWPSSGRTLSKQISIDDVNLMKEMNMNAVRMSHYPPDNHFLDACDSLGLFVLDELAGWQTAYDTLAGSKLAREMIIRDVNHPSVVIWDNGNEGGWNRGLDHWFDELDPQQRPLIHPWEVFRGTDTQHYKDFDYGTGTHQHGSGVVFPTEFMHGLYDGGHGAGLEDFWNQMWYNPLSAGGFLWVFADEGVVRTDRNGELDTDGNHAPDGIVGPWHEKEGSFFTIKEIWSPVFIENRYVTRKFNGVFNIENRYHFTNLNQCAFSSKLKKFAIGKKNPEEKILGPGKIISPDLRPGQKGELKIDLPDDFADFDALFLAATDPSGREIWTWSWPITLPSEKAATIVPVNEGGTVTLKETESTFLLEASGVVVSIGKNTGLLESVSNQAGKFSFTNGPVLAEGEAPFRSIKSYMDGSMGLVEASFSRIIKTLRWTIYPSGWLQLMVEYYPPNETTVMGVTFDYPEDKVTGMRWLGYGPYRVWKNRLKGNTFDLWEKAYNNTVTGESEFIYPEFKGYHKGFYWAEIETEEQPFSVVCASEDVFLRMLTPDPPKGAGNSNNSPVFPSGNISFLHGISPIGTKFQSPDRLGPMSQKNRFTDSGRRMWKELNLFFNFTGK